MKDPGKPAELNKNIVCLLQRLEPEHHKRNLIVFCFQMTLMN